MTASQPVLPQQERALPHPAADYERLLTLWVDLVRRGAQATAHASGDVASLEISRQHVETALERCYPTEWRETRDAAIAWESTLIHVGRGELASRCLHCRRARLGLPADVPVPSDGGAR